MWTDRWKARTDWRTQMKWESSHIMVSLSSSVSQALILRSRERWRLTGRSSAVRGASVRQTPSVDPPATHHTLGWAPRCHRWRDGHQLHLLHNARWRKSSCHSRRQRRARAWRTRSYRWCSGVGWGVGRTPGHLTPGLHQRRVPRSRRADLWPGGRCGKGPWCRRGGLANPLSVQGSGRRSVQDTRQHRQWEGAWACPVFALEGRSEGSAEGSLPPGWWWAETDLRTKTKYTVSIDQYWQLGDKRDLIIFFF